MKAQVIIIGLLAIFKTCSAASYESGIDFTGVNYEQKIFEGLINSTINSVIAKVALYDPIQVDQQEVNILGYRAELTNAHLEGFSNVAATKIKHGGLITWTLNLVVEAPRVVGFVENWKVDGNAFYGNGNASLDVRKVKAVVKATINPITQYIKTLKITPSIGSANVSITGIYNSEEVSQEVSDSINYLLNDYVNNNKQFHDTISKAALNLVRKVKG